MFKTENATFLKGRRSDWEDDGEKRHANYVSLLVDGEMLEFNCTDEAYALVSELAVNSEIDVSVSIKPGFNGAKEKKIRIEAIHA